MLVVHKRAHAGGEYGGGGRYGEGGEGGGYGAGQQLHCRALELRLKDKLPFVPVCFMVHGHEGLTPHSNDDDAGGCSGFFDLQVAGAAAGVATMVADMVWLRTLPLKQLPPAAVLRLSKFASFGLVYLQEERNSEKNKFVNQLLKFS